MFQEIANCLWAYAALDYSPGAAILGEMARSMQSKVQVFKAQELSCALWGLATLRHHPGNTTLSSMLSQSQRYFLPLPSWVLHPGMLSRCFGVAGLCMLCQFLLKFRSGYDLIVCSPNMLASYMRAMPSAGILLY